MKNRIQMKHNGYFLRLKDKPKFYLHFDKYTKDGDVAYIIKEGFKGAAVWELDKGEKFIEFHEIGNVELVPVVDIVGHEPPSVEQINGL